MKPKANTAKKSESQRRLWWDSCRNSAKMVTLLTLILTCCAELALADPILKVKPLKQDDPAWATVLLDHSTSETIGDYGCTLTSWTMLINYELEQHGIAKSYTPDTLNTLLNNYRYTKNQKDGTTTTYDGWHVPIKDGKAVGSDTDQDIGLMVQAVKDDSGLTLKSHEGGDLEGPTDIGNKPYTPFSDSLNSGNPIVVRVIAKGSGGHTVLVIGVDDSGRYVIADPGDDVKTLDDPEYKNTIYGYDWGVFQNGGVSDPYQLPSPYYIDPNDLYDPEINPDQYGLQRLMPNTAPTPEPSSLLLLGSGVLCLSGFLRKRLLTRS